jgi:hypothetical protein
MNIFVYQCAMTNPAVIEHDARAAMARANPL